MDLQKLLVVCLGAVGLFLGGCQTPSRVKVWVESLEQELREKEDYIYELEEENERLCRQAERIESRSTSNGKRSSIVTPSREVPIESTPIPRARTPKSEPESPRESLVPPTVKLETEEPHRPAPRPEPKPDLSVPGEQKSLDRPLPFTPKPNEALPAPADLPEVEPLPSPRATPGNSSRENTTTPEEIDPKVSWLEIDPVRTQGFGAEGLSGDKGLRIVLAPRNEAGQFIARPDAISIVALDPSQEGEAMRLGRWDFVATDVAAAIENGNMHDGIPLLLPWKNAAPKGSEIKLFARYLSGPREFVEAEHLAQVVLPGQVSSRWTPATRSRSQVERASAEGREEQPTESPSRRLAEALSTLTQREISKASDAAHEPEQPKVESHTTTASRPTWRPYR